MRRIISTTLVVCCAMLGLFAAPGSGAMAAGVRGTPASLRNGVFTSSNSLPPRVNFHAWRSAAAFLSGAGEGIRVIPGDRGIVISQPVGTMTHHDPFKKDTKNWEYSTWTTPVFKLDFGATEMVSSWDAQVPQDAWLRMQLQATMQNGQKTRWLDMGNYAYSDTVLDRTSVSPVDKPYGLVETDTFFSYPGYSVHAYQLRLTLLRLPGTRVSPRVWQVGAFASRIPSRQTVPPSKPGPASKAGIALNVPEYSQDIHDGQYTRYGGGGEAWCSPTSNEMVDEYWGMYPTRQQMSWINPRYQDPSVDYAARYMYDYLYQGTGNWPFNAAYAAHFGLNAEIVQLPSMAYLEDLVAHDIPVVTSQAFDNGQIAGANYSTAGHLWVVAGFTKAGNVIVNDPANPSDATVRHVFNRRQFENVWLRTYWKRANGTIGYGSGGVAYIIWPHGMSLPPNLSRANPAW